MSLICPLCGNPISVKDVHGGWVFASCRDSCHVKIHGPSKEAIGRILQDKELVKKSLERLTNP